VRTSCPLIVQQTLGAEPRRPQNCWRIVTRCDPGQAKAVMGWEPEISLEDMITEMVDADMERHSR